MGWLNFKTVIEVLILGAGIVTLLAILISFWLPTKWRP